ncbi:tyrosine-type recombinase/integrase [Streptosporangium sandarakinum]|uniref:tyrosine-type recombinase/integrase n=1 Tax=Streptosporangium sandarakinum TaxID=1260955 RepID=UPI00371C23F8
MREEPRLGMGRRADGEGSAFPCKGGRAGYVRGTTPEGDLCVTAPKHRRHVQEDARKAAGEKWRDSDLVLTTRNGTPIEPCDFNRAFAAHCRRAGVPTTRAHDTRHTRASLLAALDVHPRVAMRVLRHPQVSMAMDVYTRIPTPETRRALDRLNQSLDGSNQTWLAPFTSRPFGITRRALFACKSLC